MLDLVSQSSDGAIAIYAFGTPDQGASDTLLEEFNVTLTAANFSFSGHDQIGAFATIQGQMSPAATPATTRPRYNHPLEPAPALPFLGLHRCNTTTGTISIRAQVDGFGWEGAINFRIDGPNPLTGARVPRRLEGMAVGSHTITYVSGGPAGATFVGYSPSQNLSINAGDVRVITLNFTGSTTANLQLTSRSPTLCPSANSSVGTVQLVNNTTDHQIIPGNAVLTFTFNAPVTGTPNVVAPFSLTPVVSGSSVTLTLPANRTLVPGASIALTGTQLNLGSLTTGQNATVQVTAAPSGAVQLPASQAVVAVVDTHACGTPQVPSFTPSDVKNGASFLTGISPGALVTVFGSRLSSVSGIVTANTLPLPRRLGGAAVTVNGVAAPLLAVANVNGQEQINFQVPWEVAGQSTVMLGVDNGQVETRLPVNVLPIQAGVFMADPVFGAILHGQTFAPVTTSNPASPNEVVILYATGLGAVSANPGTGNAAAASPLSMCSTAVSVTIAGITTPAEFCGLAPGFVGLWQINFRVPGSLTPGNYNLRLSGVSTNEPLIAVR